MEGYLEISNNQEDNKPTRSCRTLLFTGNLVQYHFRSCYPYLSLFLLWRNPLPFRKVASSYCHAANCLRYSMNRRRTLLGITGNNGREKVSDTCPSRSNLTPSTIGAFACSCCAEAILFCTIQYNTVLYFMNIDSRKRLLVASRHSPFFH